MDTVHDSLTAGYPGGAAYPGGPAYPDPANPGGPAYPGGAAYPGGPAYPGNPGSDGGPSHHRPRGRMLAITAAAALVVGAGSAWAATGSGGSAVLTTSQIVAKTGPAVVDVVSTLGYQRAAAAGTGIVLTSSGEVLTNNHVIDGATAIKVRDVGNGRVYTATVKGYDASHDIAVLQLKGASGLATADLGDSSSVRAGHKVVAMGNAGGKGGAPSVATGRVTGLDQSITASDETAGTAEQLQGLIRTNAGIQPGDSGGPLINTKGEVIGLNTAASARSGNQVSSTTATQAFTVPINEATAIARQIDAGRSSASVHIGATAFLGLAFAAQNGASGFPAGPGATVAGILPGSAAASVGLATGDEVTSLGGQPVTSPSQIRSVLTAHHPGDKIGITWTDQSAGQHSATVVLAGGPAD
jgi:S1-C subfamily serine protease